MDEAEKAEAPTATEQPTSPITSHAVPASEKENLRKRPRLDLQVEPRKKGRSIFGQVFGTLKKAKEEVNEKSNTAAGKKRQDVENRILGRITQGQSFARRQDEAKRERIAASKKEEDLAIKDGVMRYRETLVPNLANFLLTSDNIPRADATDDIDDDSLSNLKTPLPPKRSNPPALYYLPKVLTPVQEKFLEKKKASVLPNLDDEKEKWVADRKKGLEEVSQLRQKADEALKVQEAQESSQTVGRERSASVSTSAAGDKMDITENKVGDADVPPENGATTAPTEDDIEY